MISVRQFSPNWEIIARLSETQGAIYQGLASGVNCLKIECPNLVMCLLRACSAVVLMDNKQSMNQSTLFLGNTALRAAHDTLFYDRVTKYEPLKRRHKSVPPIVYEARFLLLLCQPTTFSLDRTRDQLWR